MNPILYVSRELVGDPQANLIEMLRNPFTGTLIEPDEQVEEIGYRTVGLDRVAFLARRTLEGSIEADEVTKVRERM